jgi:hypothetical protein
MSFRVKRIRDAFGTIFVYFKMSLSENKDLPPPAGGLR